MLSARLENVRSHARALLTGATLAALPIVACSSNHSDGDDDAAGGALLSSGGATASGGASLSGGATGLGGASAKGGTSALAGASAISGASNAGGSPSAEGGSSNTAGASAQGGSTTSSNGGSASGGQSHGGSSAKGGASSGGEASSGGKNSGGASSGGVSSSGGSTGNGDCSAPPAPGPLLGWAAVSGNSVSTTTGGGNATPVTVTTLADLQNAVKGTNAAVIYVKGKLAAGAISVGSNKTIAGVCGAEIHGHLELGGSVNVIVRNIKIVGYGVGDCSLDPAYDKSVGCSSGADAISVQKNAHHVWFDHCDISDGTDGNLDITNGANYVTVSWTKFHYTPRKDPDGNDSTGDAGHRFSNLIGGTDSPKNYDDANSLNVTWHHNWWADHVVERQPRVRFGKNHLFNNYWSSADANYCVRAGISAHILLENNYFKGVDNPHEFNNSSDQGTAYIAANGNVYDGTSGDKVTGGGGTNFTPSYDYTPDAANEVAQAVQDGAGPK